MNVFDLSQKVASNTPLTDEERQLAAQLLQYAEAGPAALRLAQSAGGHTIFTGWPEGSDENTTEPPLFAIIGLHQPSQERWQAVKAAMDSEPRPLLGLFDMDHQDFGSHRLLAVGYDAQALVLHKFPETPKGDWYRDEGDPTMWFSKCGQYGIAPVQPVEAVKPERVTDA